MPLYIVVYDDDGLCCPYSFDDDCEGALAWITDQPVALFGSRKEAQRSIAISRKFAELQTAQGVPANDDFIGDTKKFVKIRTAMPIRESKK